jgi:hypothetical protein
MSGIASLTIKRMEASRRKACRLTHDAAPYSAVRSVELLSRRPAIISARRDELLSAICAIIGGQSLTDHDLPKRDEIVPIPGARVWLR